MRGSRTLQTHTHREREGQSRSGGLLGDCHSVHSACQLCQLSAQLPRVSEEVHKQFPLPLNQLVPLQGLCEYTQSCITTEDNQVTCIYSASQIKMKSCRFLKKFWNMVLLNTFFFASKSDRSLLMFCSIALSRDSSLVHSSSYSCDKTAEH